VREDRHPDPRVDTRTRLACLLFDKTRFGRRASRSVNGVVTTFLYDGADLAVETDAVGTVIAQHLFGSRIDEPLERKVGSTTSYYTSDALGSIVALTNATGALVETITYDAFGTPTLKTASGAVIATSTIGNRFLFTGRAWEAEVQLYNYRARAYSATLGRFLQRDPLGQLPDVNLYRYVGSVGKPLPYFQPINETNPYLYTGNNPVNRIDPLGLWYIDTNVSGGWWGAEATGGIIFSDKGIYYYGGGGVGTPGLSGGLTWSPFDPTTGWTFGVQGGGLFGIFGGQAGKDIHGHPFWEVGLVSPGVSGTAFYVKALWEPSKQHQKGCQP